MRVDKFLKNSRLNKRRTVGKSACEGGRIDVNGKEAKPGTKLKVGDILTLRFGGREERVEVTALTEHVTKETAQDMYRILGEKE